MTQFKTQYTLKNTPSIKDEYRTPHWVYEPLHEVFDFTLDPAATSKNTLCDRYHTTGSDGLKCSWEEETVFCNPPFTGGQYGDWLEKAQTEFLNNAVTSVMLVPFNAETAAFSPVWFTPAHYLIVPYKRINYLLPLGAVLTGVTFMSCLAVFTYKDLVQSEISRITRRVGRVLDLYTGLYTYPEPKLTQKKKY